MSVINTHADEIPAVLPGAENEEAREKLLLQAAERLAGDNTGELPDEDETDEYNGGLQPGKPSKRRIFTAFAGFVLFFVLLLFVVCWFFGIGVFSVSKTQPVDRTAKNGSATVPVSEEEKLKMALSLVAEKDTASKSDTIDPETAVIDPAIVGSESSLTVPPDSQNIKLPEYPANTGSTNAASMAPESNAKDADNKIGSENESAEKQANKSVSNLLSANSEINSLGRSLFFGKESKASPSATATASINRAINSGRETALPAPEIAFGTLLPVRLVGTVYTLRNSGGFVRMELTRGIEGKGYSYPAGTIVVGTLRGNEFKRAFISVNGLIDPKTGSLLKFSGELLGRDGASGMPGNRRKISSTWSRVFAGLREAGTTALGALGNWRSGGTVIISDSAQKVSGTLSDQMSGLVGGNRDRDSFIEIAAGTNGFVLVTDLPEEQAFARSVASPIDNTKTASGLTDEELADLFSGATPEKLRAAMPRMTPAFRTLAEQALTGLESR